MGMVNTCESAFGSSRANKLKELTSLDQKVKRDGRSQERQLLAIVEPSGLAGRDT